MSTSNSTFIAKNGIIANGSLIYAVGGTSNVGINNTSPDAALTVTGTANVQGNVVITGTANTGNITVIGSLTSTTNVNTVNVYATTVTSNTVGIHTGNVNATVVNASANVFTNSVFATNVSATSIVATANVTTNTMFATNVVATTISATTVTANVVAVVVNTAQVNATANVTVGGLLNVTGNSTFSANVTVTGNLYVTGAVTYSNTVIANGSFIPGANNAYTLGNTTYVWANAYVTNVLATTVTGNLNAGFVNASSNVYVGTSANSVAINTNTIVIGNASVNATINSTTFTGTSNNTSFVGSVSAANVVSNAQLSANLGNYQTTAGLSTNVATLTANNSTNFNGQPASYYTNASNMSSGTLPYAQLPTNIVNTTAAFTIAGNTTFTGNTIANGFVFSTTSIVLANGALSGASGKVLMSNATSGVYWGTVTTSPGSVTSIAFANGLNGGTITSSGTVYVANADNSIAVSATGVSVNTAYISTINPGSWANSTNGFTLNSAAWAAPGSIGGTTANSGIFTTVTATDPGFATAGAFVLRTNTSNTAIIQVVNNNNQTQYSFMQANSSGWWNWSANASFTGNVSVSGSFVGSGSGLTGTGLSFTAGTANNATNLGGVSAASYQLNSTLAANVATLTSNNATNLGGVAAANYVNTSGNYTISGNHAFTGTGTTINYGAGAYAVGYRDIPQNTQNTSYTTAASDSGGHIFNAANTGTLTYTIANNATVAWANGAAISIINGNTATLTIAGAGNVTIQLAGTTTTGSRTLVAGATATCIRVAVDRWFVGGAGVS